MQATEHNSQFNVKCCLTRSSVSADKDGRNFLILWGFFSLVASMSAYHRERLKEEKKVRLEDRRRRLRAMLQEEQDQLEAELRALVPDEIQVVSQRVDKAEELRKAREERRKKVNTLNNVAFFHQK